MEKLKFIRKNLSSFTSDNNINTIYPKGSVLLISTSNNGTTSAIKEGDGIHSFNDLPYLTYTDNLTGFTVKREYLNFTGSQVQITDSSLPDIKANIHVYVNGLLKNTTDYSINQDNIIFTSAITVPSNVIIFWFVDKENYYNRLPSTVSDLSVAIVGNNSALLRWTAGGAFSNQGVCEKYRIVYSTVNITEANYYQHKYVDITNNIGAFGQEMNAAVADLKPSTLYYFAIIGMYGTKKGLISNVISAKTKSSLTPSTIGSSFAISEDDVIDFQKNIKYYNDPLDPTNVIYAKASYMFNGTIIDNNGGPDPLSTRGPNYFEMTYTKFFSDWPNYTPYEIVIDLREVKRVDSIWFYFIAGADISVYSSQIGNQFTYIGTINANSNRNKWSKIDTGNSTKYARYIKLEFTTAPKIEEMAIYGSVLSGALPVGIKYPNNIDPYRFEQFVGTNAFYQDIMSDVTLFGTKNRFYVAWNWFAPSALLTDVNCRLHGDNSTGVQIKYLFSNNRIIKNLDNKLLELKNSIIGHFGCYTNENYVCVKNVLSFLYPDPLKPGETISWDKIDGWKMCDSNVYPQYDSYSPFAYRFISQFIFTMTARYGRNSNIDDNLMALDPTNAPLKGLDLLKYIEIENEPNRTWEGTNGYYNPEEYAALLSACYDGHMGQLGPGFGAKQADPTMKVLSSGLISQNLDYVKRMLMWFQANRTDPNYEMVPFDILSIHYYHTTTGGQTSDPTRRGLSPDSVNPVKIIANGGTYYEVMKYMSDWRDREMPGVELWIGESGYDQNPYSLQSPIIQLNRSIGLCKADFILRMMMHQAAAGINAFQQYMYRNDRQYASVVYNNTAVTPYMTSGYVDYLTVTKNPETVTPDYAGDPYKDGRPEKYPPQEAYYYARNFIRQMVGMKFSHTIRISKETHVDDVILNINTNDADSNGLCALVFTPDENDNTLNKTKCIVLWVGTEVFGATIANIAVNPNELSVKHTTFDDSEFNPTSYGTDSILYPVIINDKKCVQVPVNGTPSILWVSDVAKKRIEAPIVSQFVVDANTVRLYWTDKNKDNYATEILKYNDLTESYDSIFKGYLNGSEYDISGLSPNSSYMFMVRFVDMVDVAQRESALSEVIYVTTPTILPAATNLAQGAASYNRITITWEYDSNYIGLTEGFNIYRSDTATGVYALIASINNSLRTYTDYSVSEDNTYYYKISSFSSIATGSSSGIIAVTTLESNFDAPTVISAKTDYFGSRISLFFDVPLNPSIVIAQNITIFDGMNITSPQSIEYVSNDNRLILNLPANIASSAYNVTVGYDGLGVLKSMFNTPVNAFSDLTVVNNLNNSNLITNEIKVSFNADSAVSSTYLPFDVPANETTWNQLNHTASTSHFKPNLVDSNGEITSISVSALRFSSTTASNSISCTPQAMDLSGRSVAIGEFPSWAIGKGKGILTNMTYPMCTQYIGFHGLDSNKKYFIKQLITSKTITSSPVIVEQLSNFNSTATNTYNVYQNTTTVYSTGVINQFVPTNSLTGTVTGYSSNSILSGYRIASNTDGARNPALLCAIILCEVTNENI